MDTHTREDPGITMGWASPDGKSGEAHTTLGAMQRLTADLNESDTARGPRCWWRHNWRVRASAWN